MTQKSTTIVFRTDASIMIGTGHVMRCLTLADALATQGHICHFISRAHQGHLLNLITARGHGLTVLPDAPSADTHPTDPFHADWLGTDWHTDAMASKDVIEPLKPTWVIVDHYALDHRWEKFIRPSCQKIMVIDDLADRPHDCDLLIDQNIGSTQADYDGLLPPHCHVLAGPKYALLRPEFAEWRDHSLARRTPPQLQHILITLGGVDKDNVTGQVLSALANCPVPQDLTVTVAMGPHAPWLSDIRTQAAAMPIATDVAVGVTDMARRMAQADLCIGAAGSTSWERCCLGLPTILLVLAENQVEIAEKLSQAGAAVVTDQSHLETRLKTFITDTNTAQTLHSLSQYSARLTDGQGAAVTISTMSLQVDM